MARSAPVYDVAVVMADRRPRSLIVAELEERGLAVCAEHDEAMALRALLTGSVVARVVVLDVGAGSGLSAEQARQVIQALDGRRLILLVGAYGAGEYGSLANLAFQALVRPFRVGDVVQAVVEAMGLG